MATYATPSRASPGALQISAEFQRFAAKILPQIKRYSSGLKWNVSFASPGRLALVPVNSVRSRETPIFI
jgi:hypothetical protein